MGVKQAAKLNGGGSKPEIAGETPCKKAQGKEASFLFRINRERVHASAKRGPSAGVEAFDNVQACSPPRRWHTQPPRVDGVVWLDGINI